MKTITNLIVLVLGLTITSCSEKDLDYFAENDYLYFDTEKTTEQGYASQDFSFLFEPEFVTTKEIEIPVKVSGRFANRSRTFDISIIDSITTAKEGSDFEFVQGSNIVPANEGESTLKIEVKLTPKLKYEKVTLGLKITNSEDFLPGSDDVLILTITNRLLEPIWWNEVGFPVQLGPFTEVKGTLFLKYMEVTDGSNPFLKDPYFREIFEWQGVTYYYYYNDIALTKFNGFKNWLITSEDAPYYDENGDLVYSTIY